MAKKSWSQQAVLETVAKSVAELEPIAEPITEPVAAKRLALKVRCVIPKGYWKAKRYFKAGADVIIPIADLSADEQALLETAKQLHVELVEV